MPDGNELDCEGKAFIVPARAGVCLGLAEMRRNESPDSLSTMS